MPPTPQSPNPDFDFMLKNQQPAKRALPLPNLPKPAKIGLAVVGIIFALIIISALISGHKTNASQPLVSVMARGQETLRITALAQHQQLQDPQTQALAATVSAALASDQTQLGNYMTKNHITASKAQLTADMDKSTDASLQTASQNNNLDSAYANFLKDALSKYKADLQTAYKSAGANGQKLLSSSFDSANTLLSAAPLKS